MPVYLRRATSRDLPGIREIYNHAIRELPATFEVTEKTVADRAAWLRTHGDRYPVFVAVDGDTVLGWASLSPYAAREAYRFTVETSIYLRPDQYGRGLGTRLLATLLDAARAQCYHTAIALITGGNAASIRLHEKFGFTHVGILRQVGWKFDRWHDITIMQALLEPRAGTGNDC